MTFENYEESRYLGDPITTYLFRYGVSPNAFFAYTDHDEIINIDGVDYQPIPIQRDAVNTSGTLDKSNLTIRTPFDTGLADLFLVYPPSSVVTLVIKQGHISDPDQEFLAIWTGRVLSSSKDENEASFVCEPVSTSLKRPGLRRNYQYGCPHALYGPKCKADKAAATYFATVQEAIGSTVTLNPGWTTLDQNKFVNGLAQWVSANGEIVLRPILQIVNTDSFLLGGPVSELAPGDGINMSLGCGRNMEDCQVLHNNILNFGGQPWIPTNNPIGPKNQYY
jgi:uncharacterized phage protein (TIGR02218 family)